MHDKSSFLQHLVLQGPVGHSLLLAQTSPEPFVVVVVVISMVVVVVVVAVFVVAVFVVVLLVVVVVVKL